jgi:hypothetical protein
MCDLGIALAIGSTLIGAAGQVQEAKASSQAAKYNAQVANMNADLANTQAKQAIESGAREEQMKRLQTSQLIGKQKAAMAANGVDLNFGSPLDTIVDTAKMGELDAQTIRTNSYREAYDYRVKGANYTAEGKIDEAKARNAESAGFMGAIGTILGGGGKAYAMSKGA